MKLSEIFLKAIQFSLNTGLKSFESKTVSRLMEHIDEIEGEKAALLRQREIEGQKPVSIPLEVADAIEYFRNSYSNCALVARMMQPLERGDIHPTNVLKMFIRNNGDRFLQALVIGYTVETVESKIEVAVHRLCKAFSIVSDDNTALIADKSEFAKAINATVSKIIREDQAIQ